MQALNLFPHISRPTRFPENAALGQTSLLHHHLAGPTSYHPLCKVSFIFATSDHLPIFINLPAEIFPDGKHKITFRMFSANNQNTFTNELKKLKWEELILALPTLQ